MNILLISDIHSHNENLQKALDVLQCETIDHVFCLGDVIARDTFEILAQLPVPVTCVRGNNDRDMEMIQDVERAYPQFFHCILDEDGGEVTLENETYYLTHYPVIADEVARSGKYKTIFHGHTHMKRNELIESAGHEHGKYSTTRIINPGEILNRRGSASYAIYNTATHDVAFYPLF